MKRGDFFARMMASAGSVVLSRCAMPVRTRTERFVAPLRFEPDSVKGVIGARPFRPTGFRLDRSVHVGKTIIHNYGHGGGGVTLSWGAARMAIALADRDLEPHVGVLGGGVIGLSTAISLQRRGVGVTMYTEKLVNGTSSLLAPAQFFPSHSFDVCRMTEDKVNDVVQATRLSRNEFARIHKGSVFDGVAELDNFHISNTEDAVMMDPVIARMPWLYDNFESYVPDDTPFPAQFVYRFRTFAIDMPKYLESLKKDFLERGGEVHYVTISHATDLAALPQQVLFDCLGAGAGPIFEDREMRSISSWVVTVPGSRIDYMLVGEGCAVIPRSNSTILVGPRVLGPPAAAASQSSVAEIVSAAKSIFDKMPARGSLPLGTRSDVRKRADYFAWGSC